MTEKPSFPPDWAEDESIEPSTQTNGDNQFHVIDPGDTKRGEGYRYQDPPPYEDHNFLFKIDGKWIRWLEHVAEFVTQQVNVFSSTDYILDTIATRYSVEEPSISTDLESSAPRDETQYRGNLIKARANATIAYDGSGWVATFDDTYNIDESSSGMVVGPDALQLVTQDQNHEPSTCIHQVSDLSGDDPETWHSDIYQDNVASTDTRIVPKKGYDYGSSSGEQYKPVNLSQLESLTSPSTKDYCRVDVVLL